MSYINPEAMAIREGNQLDPFGLIRTSYKIIAFEYAGQYDLGLLLWDQATTGTGTITYEATSGAAILSTGGTASGARALRQSHQYILYQPGKGRQAIIGFQFTAAVTNVRRRVGLYDDSNGWRLEQTTTGLRFVVRSSISGAPVETTFEQADWNIDGFGVGTKNPSGVTLNIAAAQALVIEVTGYNAAYVRIGFLIKGRALYAHEIENVNISPSFAVATSTLPVRYEIENTGVTAGASTMKASSCVVYDEDGDSGEFTYGFGASRGVTSLGVTTRRPVLSIRPKTTFNGLVNRGHIHLAFVAVIAKTNDALVEIVRNGSLTGAAFNSAGANSIANFDTTATAITGGDVLYTDYAVAGTGATTVRTSRSLEQRFGLVNDLAGTSPDTLSIVVTSTSGTSNILAAANWQEQR